MLYIYQASGHTGTNKRVCTPKFGGSSLSKLCTVNSSVMCLYCDLIFLILSKKARQFSKKIQKNDV